MKSSLLVKFSLCLALFLSALGLQQAKADHISSVDMFVDYIGTGPTDMKYKVTIVLYRICIGNNLALGTTTYGTTQVKSANLNFTKNLNPTIVGGFDTLDNLCPDFSKINSCRVLANVNYSGYQTATYVDTVTVPGRSNDLKFTWSSCCRLLTYTNINQPSFYVEAGINNLIKYDNSTPRYLGQPFTFCCTNQPSSLSNIPSDPNGDSLVTYSNTPMQTATTTVGYNAGFSATQPTGTSAPAYYNVSPISGKANFLATGTGKYVFGYRTEDWDRASGKQLGYIMRDLTITVLPCTNLPPYIDSIPQGITGVKHIDTSKGEVVLTACPQVPLSFVVNSHSNNPNGLIYMRPASALPTGMTVTPTITGGTGYVTVNWTPTAGDIGPHVVTILAVDSTCAVGQEITLRSEFTFTVNVRPGLDAGPDLYSCPLGERPVKLGSNANPTSNITWTNLNGQPAPYLSCTSCPNPLAGPPVDYTYVVTTDDISYVCKNSDTVVVFIDKTNSIDAPQDNLIVCRPGYMQLTAEGKGPQPLANLPCGTANPLICLSTDQQTATAGSGTNAANNTLNTPFYSASVYHKYQFIIPKRELLDAGFYSGTIHSISFLSINPTLLGPNPLEEVTISMGCVQDDNFPTPIGNNSFLSTIPVANLTTYTITPNAWNTITLDNPYSWDTTTNLLVDICMGPMTTANPGGLDPVAMTPGQTIQRYDNLFNVCGGNGSTVNSYQERPVVRFTFCPSPELPFKYTWLPGTFLNDSTVQNPTAFVAKSMNYAVQTVGRNGCRIVDTLHIIVPVHELTAGPNDTVACRYQPVPLFATGADGYQWYEVQGGVFTDASGSLNCTNCQYPIATPAQTTTYAVVYTNDVDRGNTANPGSSLGCPDTMFVRVIIKQLPNVFTTNKDTTIGYGKSVQLFAMGASQYTWTPVGSLNDPNSPAPIASPKETTTYIVSGVDSNGCIYRDTVKVSVSYVNNLLIPSGFTPNNDGRNDIFKIVNPSFQRLMEFRVFNRWGQEVFSTSDINSGWDGTWKGVEQPIGTYQYLIRVGSPDGKSETYKGDVMLIR